MVGRLGEGVGEVGIRGGGVWVAAEGSGEEIIAGIRMNT